jgi:hypothetical protein
MKHDESLAVLETGRRHTRKAVAYWNYENNIIINIRSALSTYASSLVMCYHVKLCIALRFLQHSDKPVREAYFDSLRRGQIFELSEALKI